MAEQKQSSLSVSEVEKALIGRQSPDLADALTDFGEMMLDEVRERTGQLDSKALAILGYAGAIFALLIIGRQDLLRLPRLETVCVVIGGAAALIALVSTFLALRIRSGWSWPSERDWFQVSEFDDPVRLRYFYAISMLETYRVHNKMNQDKADLAEWAQWAMATSALGMGLSLVVTLVRAGISS